jgi:hypothetical protein
MSPPPGLTSHADCPSHGGVGKAQCRPVKRQCPAPRHSSATAPHPLALDGCRQVSELLAEQTLEAHPKPLNTASVLATTDRVFWQISGKRRSERREKMRYAWWS